jgi:hypothetical protein
VSANRINADSTFGEILLSYPARAWFAESHEIVAIIAADDLTPTARSYVAQILNVPADTRSIEKAGQGSRFTGAAPTRELRHRQDR